MSGSEGFHRGYRVLERRMKALAESDGNVFVPNPEPTGPVEYVLICMEPSFGRWADSRQDGRSKVETGFRNFLYSIEDFILHFCAQSYLCKPGERYHITDLSKGAMLVDSADVEREERYARWYPLLLEELELVTRPEADIVAVGKSVAEFLERQSFPRPVTRILHYSPQAARARNVAIEGREQRFQEFKDSVSLADLEDAAKKALRSAGVPPRFQNEALSRLAGRELTISRKKLLFIYKEAFESLRS